MLLADTKGALRRLRQVQPTGPGSSLSPGPALGSWLGTKAIVNLGVVFLSCHYNSSESCGCGPVLWGSPYLNVPAFEYWWSPAPDLT